MPIRRTPAHHDIHSGAAAPSYMSWLRALASRHADVSTLRRRAHCASSTTMSSRCIVLHTLLSSTVPPFPRPVWSCQCGQSVTWRRRGSVATSRAAAALQPVHARLSHVSDVRHASVVPQSSPTPAHAVRSSDSSAGSRSSVCTPASVIPSVFDKLKLLSLHDRLCPTRRVQHCHSAMLSTHRRLTEQVD